MRIIDYRRDAGDRSIDRSISESELRGPRSLERERARRDVRELAFSHARFRVVKCLAVINSSRTCGDSSHDASFATTKGKSPRRRVNPGGFPDGGEKSPVIGHQNCREITGLREAEFNPTDSRHAISRANPPKVCRALRARASRGRAGNFYLHIFLFSARLSQLSRYGRARPIT